MTDNNAAEIEERLADALERVEALQSEAADAEARAATAIEQAAETASQREANDAELAEARRERDELREQLADAAVRYREARLAAHADVPPEMVAEAVSLEEIDRQFEAAQKVVAQLKDRMKQEQQSARVPVGSPGRRAADPSSLSAGEKIRLGLQQLAERGGR